MKKVFVLFSILAMTANITFANALGGLDAGAINRQYTRDLRVHEMATRAKNRSAIVTTKTAPKTQEEITTSNLKEVVFINNASIPTAELNAVISNKIDKPMNHENIAAIRKDIMKYYQANGYFSAVAIVTAQDTQNGVLTIEVKEGGKNSIVIEEL